MPRPHLEPEKALNTLLFVIQQLGQPGYHKVFKTLYFAEQRHLTTWGASLMAGDRFVKMVDGPVPSDMYNFIKFTNGNHDGRNYPPALVEKVKNSIAAVGRHNVIALTLPDVDYLAQAEIDSLLWSVEKCATLGFGKLRDLSHDQAWESVKFNETIEPVAIAAAGGATPEELDYLRESLSNDFYASL
ncbi:SocA family protein [Hymenobacter sp. 15J16-1T3B]|uniref:Panacea domain-containing protein n=1 Tax=Hymenobacter sp. 15J16-1T3B TaxID=2886941 RepID=UPI001D10ABE5|nr:Panacea domain-containing protein [Hymenobacter sp. 15J16-1T3B]MCC3156433.1 SocA family protein [Hymenobacter sp. 15J16-1T3B]